MKKMKIIAAHPTGNANVRSIVTAFSKAEMLSEFITTLSIYPKSKWLKILPKALREELLRRSFDLPSHQIHTHPFLELVRIISPKMGLAQLVRNENAWASVDAVYHNLDKITSKRLSYLINKEKVTAVYAYEDGALATFTLAKELDLKCIYDLPIAFWGTSRKLMLEEAQRLPTWAITLGGGISDSTSKLDRKSRELELADIVIAPGKFVADSLPKWASNKKIVIAPFGSPRSSENIKNSDCGIKIPSLKKKQLRILFVGSMGQRKGLGDLFAAMRLLKNENFELVVMGSLLAPMEFYRSELPEFTYEEGRPHQDVLKLMRSCDVFCLPSIVEGRALVMQEAMSQGLPIIITPNTGGEDLVIEGVTGFLVPIRSPALIAEKLEWFNNNLIKMKEMGRLAQQHAETYSWEMYGSKIINEIKEFLG